MEIRPRAPAAGTMTHCHMFVSFPCHRSFAQVDQFYFLLAAVSRITSIKLGDYSIRTSPKNRSLQKSKKSFPSKNTSLRGNGDPTAGTGSGGHVAVPYVCILSMHVSSMVADARFGRAAACCLDTNPRTERLSTPFESVDHGAARWRVPHSARTLLQ